MSIDLHAIMKSLAAKRPIFHSEADFQHALAWEIHSAPHHRTVRMEYPMSCFQENRYLDIWLPDPATPIAIELKYKTHLLQTKLYDEEYHLKDQGAQDLGRYYYVDDISRLERVVARYPLAVGYALFLTNDQRYWMQNTPRKTNCDQWRIDEGKTLTGRLAWLRRDGDRHVTVEEPKAITLKNTYTMHWERYPSGLTLPGGSFRYLLVEVKP